MSKQVNAVRAGVGAAGTNVRKGGASLARRTPATMVGKTVAALRQRWPGAVDATVAGAQRTTRAVQSMSDSNLRSLSAGSVGFGAGLLIGGAPRLVAAAGIAPALVMGAVVLARPGRRDSTTPQTDAPDAVTAGEDARLEDDGGPPAD